jgi:hypothetical protein
LGGGVAREIAGVVAKVVLAEVVVEVTVLAAVEAAAVVEDYYYQHLSKCARNRERTHRVEPRVEVGPTRKQDFQWQS